MAHNIGPVLFVQGISGYTKTNITDKQTTNFP